MGRKYPNSVKLFTDQNLAEKIKKLADERGLSISALLRVLVLKEISRTEGKSGKRVNAL